MMITNRTKKLSLIAITWPLFIESLLQMSLRISDTVMISKVSDAAVAAVGVSNQLIMFTFFLFNFIAAGSAIVIAQYLGAKKEDEVGRLSAGAISLNLLFGLLISLVMVVLSNPLLRMFDLEPALFSMAKSYLFIVGGFLFIQATILTVSAIIQVHGFTRETMLVAVGMNLVNIIGNYAFIYGELGFPKLGVPGVAISTAASQMLGLMVYLLILYKRVKVDLKWKYFIKHRLDHIKKVLSIGIPASGEQLSYSASQVVTTYFITSLGAEMLSTRIYTQNIIFFIMILAIALGRGTQIIIGHLIGAGEKDQAYRQSFRSLKWSLLMALGGVSLICLFRERLLNMFTDDVDIISLGATLLLMGFLLEPGRCFNIIIGQSLRAAGDARFMMFAAITVMWGMSVPLGYLLGIHLGYGLIGIWAAFIADEWVRGIILYFRWKSRAWEKKVLVEPGPKEAAESV